uniref:protoporphyrinogen oxidase n=1 Tax=Oceanithermus sp. TaxID=2268145 RepID=UPI0025F63687
HPLPEGLNVVIPSRFGPLLTTPLLSPIGKLRAGLDLFLPRGPEGDEPFGAFIERRLGREVWRNLAAPLTGGIYGGDPYELSTLAAFPMLKELERQHRSLVLGSLATMRRRKGSREGGGLFASLSGGLGEVALAVQKQATGVRWRMRSPVERADREEQGWYLFGPWGTERFDAVVFATPAPATATALEPLDRELARTLRSIPYGSAATVTFALEEEAVPPLKGHGVLIAAGEGFAARGFTWLSRKWANRAPAGKLLVRAYFSGEPADLDEDALIEAARDDLKRLLAFEPQPLKTWAFRWPRGMPQYTVGHLERIRALEEASKRWPGLELIGAAYRGVGLPEVVRDGRQAAERLLASLA